MAMPQNEPKNNKAPKFLVIDDSVTMRRIIRMAMARIGFPNVDDVASAAEALAKIKANPNANMAGLPEYHCIMTDWNMPEFDGLSLVQEIRNIPGYSKVPVIMITTEQNRNDVVEALKNGVDVYIVKPFTPELLKSKIDSLMTRIQSAQAGL